MKALKKTLIGMVVLCVITTLLILAMPTPAIAKSVEELATESEAYCATTAQTRPTPPSVIVDKVNQACELLKKEGKAAFPKFKGKGSPFIFEGTYIWIHRLEDVVMLMHPIKYKMEGNDYVGLKDVKGKRFFAAMNDLVKKEGAGWVSYLWPKPGSEEIIEKVSYVKLCKSADGENLVLGCGIYNASKEDLAKLTIY